MQKLPPFLNVNTQTGDEGPPGGASPPSAVPSILSGTTRLIPDESPVPERWPFAPPTFLWLMLSSVVGMGA